MYSVKIETVSRELTAKERVSIKDTSDCLKLDKVIEADGPTVLDIDYFAVLNVHNDNAKDSTDYNVYVLVDKNGVKYTTSSESFFSSFYDIYSEMSESNEEWAIKAYAMPSKNREGKYFLTCSIC